MSDRRTTNCPDGYVTCAVHNGPMGRAPDRPMEKVEIMVPGDLIEAAQQGRPIKVAGRTYILSPGEAPAESPDAGALWGLYFALYYSSAETLLGLPTRVAQAYMKVQRLL